jgi:hypothetical protein
VAATFASPDSVSGDTRAGMTPEKEKESDMSEDEAREIQKSKFKTQN